MRKIAWILIPVLLASIIILLMFVEVPYNIRSKGIAMPLKEWGLNKTTGGTLTNVLEDHLAGSINQYKLMEFQRGDMISILFNHELFEHQQVQAGDTIAVVISLDQRMQLIEMQGDMMQQYALLDVTLTGDKPEAIQAALDKVDMARQELATQELLTQRIIHLYEQELVSQQEYEMAVNDLMVKKFALEIAQSNYEAIAAGEKTEEAEVIRTRIASLERRIEQLEEQINAMNVLSPINGQIIRKYDMNGNRMDEVIRIADLSSMLIFTPVDAWQSVYIQPGMQVQIQTETSTRKISGKVIALDNSVQMINRRPKIFVTIQTENHRQGQLLPGMVVDTRITADTLSIKDYLLRITRVVYQNQ
ncbi:MAG: HlyD family efflux transporter periplasmic adaptor subunit [Bacteroidia bacterium]|nr:MAG: HlyD family efflux transporter periplasmic adaptor subunit [Bacteroidia bacterium]